MVNSPEAISIVAISFSIISILIAFLKFRESQEQSNDSAKSSIIKQYITFENEVQNFLKNAKLSYSSTGPTESGFDFIIKKNSKTIIIEVKNWRKSVPIFILTNVLDQLHNTKIDDKAEKAIIITRGKIDYPKNIEDKYKIKIMNLREFRKYIK